MVGDNSYRERYANSMALLDRARRVTPGESQTFSKSWTQYPLGAAPVFATRAAGGRVWDVDGNEYIDWPMAIGPLLLGHNHPVVCDALISALREGIAFSLPTDLEVALSERLTDWFPYADRVRFGKNGSDVTCGAIRAARAFTKREIVLCCGYHGWHDWFIGTTERNAGVPSAVRELTVPFPYNDIASLEQYLDQYRDAVACIILEPMGLLEPDPMYLHEVRRLADATGAILIFDECWTGFRVHRQGAFGYFGVAPDLACFGKALGNGVPISALVGRADVMDVFSEAFFSFTFGGDRLGMIAAQSVLDVIEQEPVLEHVKTIGNSLMVGIRDAVEKHRLHDHVDVIGYPARHALVFSGDGYDGLLLKSVFQQEAIAGGILAAGWHAPSYAHEMADVETTLDVYDSVLARLSISLRKGNLREDLQGEIVQPVFRKL